MMKEKEDLLYLIAKDSADRVMSYVQLTGFAVPSERVDRDSLCVHRYYQKQADREPVASFAIERTTRENLEARR